LEQKIWNNIFLKGRPKKVDDYTTSNVFEWLRAPFSTVFGAGNKMPPQKKQNDHEILQLGTKSIIKKTTKNIESSGPTGNHG